MPHDGKFPMLKFVQLMPYASSAGNFLLRDLPGSGKRIDVLCRELSACFDWGPTHWPRSRIELIALLNNDVILTFRDPADAMPVGERGWALIIKNSLQGAPPNYISVTRGDLESIIEHLHSPPATQLWVLHEEGVPFYDIAMQVSGTQNSFMLGDYRGFDSQSEETVSSHSLARVSLGNISYLGSHCLVSIISRFERMVKW
jgi:tRNA (pseudouridine54-N1)-methyltransferase